MKGGTIGFQFDTSKSGLGTLFKEYQEIILKFLWTTGPEGVGSGKAWVAVNKVLMEKEESISSASVIFFLQDMAANGYLTYSSETGKGGRRKIYSCLLNETEFKESIAKSLIEKLLQEFPKATKQALKTIIDTHKLSVD